jgi:hypothetical protein
VIIHRNGRLSPTVGGRTRPQLHQISRREFDALPRKRQAAILGEEYRRGTALVRDSELSVSRTTTEHFNAKSRGHVIKRSWPPQNENLISLQRSLA